MPQKKNPDALELLRGKAGRTVGHTVALLTMLKGLPTAYNKDMQEDKQALFDALDTAEAALQIAQGVLATLTPNESKMRNALNSFMLATDLSEYLVRKGVRPRGPPHRAGRARRCGKTTRRPSAKRRRVALSAWAARCASAKRRRVGLRPLWQVPFRETHHISGRAVQMAEERGCALTDLSVADLKSLHPLFTDDVSAPRPPLTNTRTRAHSTETRTHTRRPADGC